MKHKYSKILTVIIISAMLGCSALAFTGCDKKATDKTAEDTGSSLKESDEVKNFDDPYEAEGMTFSVKSGFYSNSFYLNITAADGTEIYYTLDGSVPDLTSPKFTEPLLIKDRSSEPAVLSKHTEIIPDDFGTKAAVPKEPTDKATVVRAMAVDKNGVQSPVVSNTYFIGFDEKADYYKNTRVISLTTDEASLYDYEKGIYVLGKTYHDWKESAEYDETVPEWFIPANYTEKGREWERPASFQFFENGKCEYSLDAGIRIHGGASRSYTQKSFNVYARKAYGASKVKYDLFSGNVKTQTDGTPITKFDTFMLRNGGNDAKETRFRDKLIQSLSAGRDFLTQGMEPCIVFINGEYWGHYELTEKMDAEFIGSHCGVSPENICIIKREELEEGDEKDLEEFRHLYSWIKSTDFSDDESYKELCEKVDMKGFMEYISAELYINNSDWSKKDSANSAMWRSSVTDGSSPYADGKWRFIMFDTEYSTGVYGRVDPSEDNFATFLNEKCFLSVLFESAMKNETFRNDFQATFKDVADNDFNTEKVNALIDTISDNYEEMVTDTYSRFWSDQIEKNTAKEYYRDCVESVRYFFNNRHDTIIRFMERHLKTE